jgi:hypothetical protein
MKNLKPIVVRLVVVAALIVVAIVVYSNRENFKRGLKGEPEMAR